MPTYANHRKEIVELDLNGTTEDIVYAGMDEDTVFTIDVTGVGTAAIAYQHLGNALKVAITDTSAETVTPFTFYGKGFRKFQIQATGVVKVSFKGGN